ncbi:MAG TPA: DUF3152 domain-containing protein [Mycobacteriales bacterium]|nr:DUF3152 domain-containing protein [Mycobacteriales bacterium]
MSRRVALLLGGVLIAATGRLATDPVEHETPSAGPVTPEVATHFTLGGALPAPSAAPTGRASADGEATTGSRPKVVSRGDGRLHVMPGQSKRFGTGPLKRFSVSVEGRLGVDARAFTKAVETTLGNSRSWINGGRMSVQRVDSGPVDFRVVLASPVLTDRMCAPLDTEGEYSCANGSTAVLNSMRWVNGADSYSRHLIAYRHYLVNHEVGHALGRGHADCPGPGLPAPVMMQQTVGVGACLPSAWPYP